MLRELEALSASAVAMLFFIAGHGECTKPHLEEELNISVATASRVTDMLSSATYLKGGDNKRLKGVGLIEKIRDPNDKRIIILKLSKKGEKFMKAFKQVLWPNGA